MEENSVDSTQTNDSHQPSNNEWRNEHNDTSNNTASNNDNYEQHIVDHFNNTSINDNSVYVENAASENQDNNYNCNNDAQEDGWDDQNSPKSQYNNRNDSGHRRGRGGYNKPNNSWNNNSSNHFNNSGRGRGIAKRYNNENESFENGYNSNYNNQDGGYHNNGHRGRGRGRGQHRGRGGRFRDNSNNDWNGSNEEGQNKFENDKSAVPKPVVYIPPEIENDESIDGIEAGQHFDDYEKIEVKVSGNDPPKSIISFPSSGLRNILLDNLAMCNFSKPTPIQNYAIPIVMAGRDLMASAQTGSGKTAAYVLPILHNLLNQPSQLVFDENHCEPQVLIMAPTRELVVQIRDCVYKFAKGTHIKCGLLYGGTSVIHQKEKILNGGIHVLVATPGRLKDFVNRGIVSFSSVKFFVLDEADRMLDLGFKPEIELVVNHERMTSNDIRQTLMFSATFPSDVQHMAKSYLKEDYIFVAVGDGGACKDVEQIIQEVKKYDKKKTLFNLLKEMDGQSTIVFVEEKRVADFTATYLSEMDLPTTSIHGDREQAERELALKDFRTNKMKILVATAVAARGLDIKDVTLVINYDLPKTMDEYVHRIGRTGRLGNAGKAISFFDPQQDGPIASKLIGILKQAEQEIPPWLIKAAEHVESNSAVGDFNDIRTDVDTTSEMVDVDEQWD